MKVGLKILTTSSVKELEERQFADYIEIKVVPGHTAEKYQDYDMDYVIHAPHTSDLVNLASKRSQLYSINAVRQALDAADLLNAKIVIVHAGSGKLAMADGDSSPRILMESLQELKDRRVVLENLPYYDKNDKVAPHYYAYDYTTLKRYSTLFGSRICLDFSHAIVSSVLLHRDIRAEIKRLQKLDTRIFHISDGIAAKGIDQHLSLFQGDFDLEYFKGIIKASRCKRVTLETPPDITRQKKEYEWLKS